jgi:DNA-binding NarL/FixJ family response regulator
MRALRVLIADDHAAVRRGLRSVIESGRQWSVCGEASDGVEAVDLATQLRPDVVLIDLTMPHLNGLEAARRIRGELPDAQVFVLTTHEFDELDEAVRRTGASGVVVKSEADHSLVAAMESLRPRRAAIHLAGSTVNGHRHIAAFFHSAEERYRVLASFIGEGLETGERALHIIDPPDRETHLRQLRERGLDVDGAEGRGQLVLVPWAETYLRGGQFDLHAMLELVGELVDTGAAQGYPLTRAVAHMEWAAPEVEGVADLVEYEARLNDLLAVYDDVVICAYDLSKFSADTIVDVMRGHPAVIIGGLLGDNPFYEPAAEFIEELAERKQSRDDRRHTA